MNDFTQEEIIKTIADRAKANFRMNPEDYIDDDGLVVCGKCHKRKQVRIPNYSEPVVCMCDCDAQRLEKEQNRQKVKENIDRINHLKSISLMDEKFRTAYFDVFQKNQYNEKNLKLCMRYVAKFDEMVEKNQGLLFWGGVGTGKSFVAACIANQLLDKGYFVMMTSLVKLIDSIQKSSQTEEEIITMINKPKLLILDDLGAERSNEYATEKVYNIIDSRYRRKLPLIITTNRTMTEMKDEIDLRYSRIYDRIFECCYPMQFTGKSWRKIEANNRFKEMEKFLNE